jgi:hypothetical protein
MLQQDNDLVVRADLPGMNRDDMHVDINDTVLSIQRERKQEHEEEHEGGYRNERSYGSFYRSRFLKEPSPTARRRRSRTACSRLCFRRRRARSTAGVGSKSVAQWPEAAGLSIQWRISEPEILH